MLLGAKASAAAKSLDTTVSLDELTNLRVECRQYIAEGGERGAIAAEILRISDAFDKLSAEIKPLLKP